MKTILTVVIWEMARFLGGKAVARFLKYWWDNNH